MALIGYAQVSTEEQQTDPQLDELRAAGCREVFEERASGASRSRVELARCLERIGPGDTLVVVRIDRLARSLAHLLEVIERLRARGAHFRSLGDPIDTASPQGIFTLQVLGAAAELERALIRERTKAGLKAAKARGRVGGNPGLRAGDPAAVRKIAAARATTYLADLLPGLDEWLPVVRRLRPERPWGEVVRAVNAALPAGTPALDPGPAGAGGAAARGRGAGGPCPARSRRRAASLPTGWSRSSPGSPAAPRTSPSARSAPSSPACARRTPRGGLHWSPSSVAYLLDAGPQGRAAAVLISRDFVACSPPDLRRSRYRRHPRGAR